MRVLISAVGYALASLALGPVNSGIVLAMGSHMGESLVMPRVLSEPRRRRHPADMRRPRHAAAPGAHTEALLLAAADKRARKNARRLELAA
jgi:hypothetical protein